MADPSAPRPATGGSDDHARHLKGTDAALARAKQWRADNAARVAAMTSDEIVREVAHCWAHARRSRPGLAARIARPVLRAARALTRTRAVRHARPQAARAPAGSSPSHPPALRLGPGTTAALAAVAAPDHACGKAGR